MARRLKKRLKISGTLLAKSPIHVGGLSAMADVDLTLAVNGTGAYYIPGTSLAGALRGWLKEESSRIDALWGYQKSSNGKDEGHASFVVVEDAPIEDATRGGAGETVVTEIRDGVGIDRFSGSAAETVKFNRAILPKGVRIPLALTLEQGGDDEAWAEARCLFADTLHALQSGAIRLGAAKTRGLGKIELQDLKIVEQDLSSFDGMFNTLSADESNTIGLAALVPEGYRWQLPQQIEITVGWKPVGPVMVKAEAEGIAVDMLPLVSQDEGQPCFVIPGSAVKGALRSQAERIMRTLLSQDIPQTKDPKQRFIDQLNGIPVVDQLFGQGAKQQGALAVDDCYATQKLAAPEWAAVETATSEQALQTALQAANLSHVQQAFHVGIDRWTGGAADSQLYSTLELMDVNWAPICLTVDLARLQAAEKTEEEQAEKEQIEEEQTDSAQVGIALLVLLLRDLARGRIPLGYGTNRGMGAIALQSVTIQGRSLPTDLAALENTSLFDSDMALQDSLLLQQLNQQWQAWLSKHQNQSTGRNAA